MKRIILNISFSGLTLAGQIAFAQTTAVKINPNVSYQTIKGWGGSLCWWANMTGGFPQEKVDTICKWITSPNELNMNVFRFNIGGGDNPSHSHIRKDGQMPGYKASSTVTYDWSQDANQRKILLKLNSLRNDVINEAFSNSPPYWMTKSQCSGGNTDGSVNLKDDQYVAFADYLTEIVKYYKEKQTITFSTIEPFNEPSAGWTAYRTQEGCHWTLGAQKKLIPLVYQKLKDKNMLAYCGIAAMDGGNLDDTYKLATSYVTDETILPKFIQINGHSYNGTKHKELYELAKANNKELWQSESGPYSVSSKGIDNYLVMAQRIIKDLRDLKPVVWCDWQLGADNEPNWGLIDANYSTQAIKKNKSYFVRMQCSRFIKQGYTIIDSDQINTVTALSPSKTELVVIICNQQTTVQNLILDFTFFSALGVPVVYRTSNTEDCKKITASSIQNKKLSYNAPAASLTTFVVHMNGAITSIEEDKMESSVSGFPNPFYNEIQLKSTGDFEYTILDMFGTIVEKGNGNTSVYVGRSLSPGIYLVKIQHQQRSTFLKVCKK